MLETNKRIDPRWDRSPSNRNRFISLQPPLDACWIGLLGARAEAFEIRNLDKSLLLGSRVEQNEGLVESINLERAGRDELSGGIV